MLDSFPALSVRIERQRKREGELGEKGKERENEGRASASYPRFSFASVLAAGEKKTWKARTPSDWKSPFARSCLGPIAHRASRTQV